MSERLNRLKDNTRRALASRKGHNVLLYLLFVCVAFVFWFFLSLDNEVQRDFEIPMTITNVPDSVVLIGDVPPRINVVVYAKGSQLLPYTWGRMSELKLKFSESSTFGGKTFQLSKARLEARIRDYFGQSVQVLSIKPDSLKVDYTTSPGVKLPLRVIADVEPSLQCVINGDITCDYDSVTVYSMYPLPYDLRYVDTDPIALSNLRDSTTVMATVQSIPGCRIIPERVPVHIPVEPLIAKRRQAQIDVINLPVDVGFITFPSVIDVNYLVPMSLYNADFPIKVYVDYNTLTPGATKIKVNLSPPPEMYHNVTLSVDSIDYVLEKRIDNGR